MSTKIIEVDALSAETIRVPVSAKANGAKVDPTGFTVQHAFVASGTNPVSGDWKPGSWDTDNGQYMAQCTIGPTPGVVALNAGTTYDWYVTISSGAEVPVKLVGHVRVT